MRTIVKKAGRKMRYALTAAAVMLCVLLLDETAIVSQAADIKLNSNAKVRSEASTESTVVTNVSNGTTLSSLGEVTGADGYTWYQVSVNGATGYIRSDLADKTSGNMTQAEVERENSYTETSATVSETAVTSGTISVDSANVRKGPSSSDAPVTNVKSGTEVAISGEAIGADGNTWYQVSVNGKTGFVRSDLIEPAAVEEPETPEAVEGAEEDEETEPAEDMGTTEISNVISSRIIPGDVDLENMMVDAELLEEWESGNYYVLYTKDSEDNDDWYLYSLSDNQFEKIKSLHDDGEGAESGLLTGNGKIILLIVAALFVVLILVCILLALKLHEYREYYEDEDDEDEDDDEDDEDDDDDDEDDDEDDEDDEDDDDERPVRKSRWSPKNFLSRRDEYDDEDDDEEDEDDEDEDDDDDDDEEYLDDDDFEFEFLNMDGKDKFR